MVTCNDPRTDWAGDRFAGRCYFYPERDCPGWRRGRPCGRIGEPVPYRSWLRNILAWRRRSPR